MRHTHMQDIAMIGLGRMGYNMALRLANGKKHVVVWNRSTDKTKEIAKKKYITGAETIEELVQSFGRKKRIIWLMLPAGDVTREMITQLLPCLKKGDIIINGANAFYKEAQEQALECNKVGVHYFDAGVSGGIHGLKRGYALMIGGPKNQFKYIEPFVKILAPKQGYGYFGPVGSGHFVKSVHNIVEYVFMEGLAEGAELLGDFEHKINVLQAFKAWQPASIVSSSLLDWAVQAMERPDFKRLEPNIMSVTLGELTDTVEAVKGSQYAKAFHVSKGVRCCSPEDEFVDGKRLIAGIRREFGGHEVTKKTKKK